MFESGADERNVLPKPVQCIFAAGKWHSRRLHRLFGEWLVVHPQLRLRLRPVRHQVLQHRHTHGHSSLHGEPSLTGEPFLTGELLLTGERVSAEQVLASGLITAVAQPEALDGVVDGYLTALLSGGPQAMTATKDLLRRVPTMTRADAFTWTAQLSGSLFTSDEAREGMTAFLTKAKPSWHPQA